MKSLKNPFKHLLISSAFLIVSYVLVRITLGFFDLQFRAWVNVIWIALTILVFIAGLIQRESRPVDTKAQFKISVFIFAVFLMVCIPYIPFALTYKFIDVVPLYEDVIEIDGQKYIASHNIGFFDSDISFYEYKNFMFSSAHNIYPDWGYDTDEEGNVIALYYGEETVYDIDNYLD